ncbi:uncharacterized protein LOC122327340 isoform X2 [Puntigrus tetrazona]|uniref:uncharacterized protein LOC122327340 isoform X2 n=1 Tax=Puntigrus tetrazona TaxID=1606681 RepID=UPI001C8A2F98|nr:uncharacterized protein LOC122327340 isoform X2 [Puntigrus tetrazona]
MTTVKMDYFWSAVILLVTGASAVKIDGVSVSLMEGDTITLHTGVTETEGKKMQWYYNGTRIARITGDPNKTCTDVQCMERNRRFRGRLYLDHQTGSLTIRNITSTDSGEYKLQIIIPSISSTDKIFNVIINGHSAAEREEMRRKSVKEGGSVTLDPGVIKTPNDLMRWHFNDIPVNEIPGYLSRSCADVQCKDADERLRDRLEVNQTGSLTITNTRTTDSGLYKLQINGSGFSIMRTFSVNVTAVPDSGQSTVVVAGICAGVGLLVCAAAAAAVICYCRRQNKGNRKQHNGIELTSHNCSNPNSDIIDRTTPNQNDPQDTTDGTSHPEKAPLMEAIKGISPSLNGLQFKDTTDGTSPTQTDPQLEDTTDGTSPTQTDPQLEDTTDGTSPTQTDLRLKITTDGTSPTQTDPQLKDTTDGASPTQTDTQLKDTTDGASPTQTDTQLKDTTDGTSHHEKVPLMDAMKGKSPSLNGPQFKDTTDRTSHTHNDPQFEDITDGTSDIEFIDA